ncbi:Uncharacterized protein FWK35_00028525 [Aphis craccivora]|uniref:Uncharacterized protein n=1 Tax=Aphis craccivora TaxID=307492 RepID=A0A6G0ZC75_APHCR|nr:Uncharacterized protein FWK35_00028525 [Aphis craccivora]
MDKEGIFFLSQEEVEFLELIAEVSRAAAMLPIPAIHSGDSVDESSNTLSSDGVNVDCHPTESVCSESESEPLLKAELIIPIPRHIENATVPKPYTKSVIHVEIFVPAIIFRNIRMTSSDTDLFDGMPVNPRAADIRNYSLKFSMTVYFPWRVEDKQSSTSLFSGEITESRLPRIPLCLGNSTELANALRASAFLNALKLPMTVTFLRRNTDIVSTYFFGGSGSVQIRFLGCESSILGQVEPSTPPTEIIMERTTEFRDSLSAYEPTDEALQSEQSSCTSTLEVMVSDNIAESVGDGMETMVEIKPAEEPEEWINIQRKPFFKRLGRRLLKIGRSLCCCYYSKLD